MLALFVIMIEIMSPNIDKALPKISTIKIFTNRTGFCASANAQPLPTTPTHNPEDMPLTPAIMPEAKRMYPFLKSSEVGGFEIWS